MFCLFNREIVLNASYKFDCPNYEIYFKKLDIEGLYHTFVATLKSYLSNISQFVKCIGYSSITCAQTFGVSQGAVLGTPLLILYSAFL